MRVRSLEQLAAGGVALAEQGRDVRVGHVEDVVQEQDRAFGGREALQDHQECHRDLVEHLHPPDAGLVQIDRLRQAIAAALLVPGARRAELVEAEARHGREQERFVRLDVFLPLPADPRFLNDVLGAGHIAQHAIGEGEQRRAMLLEGLGSAGHASPSPETTHAPRA